MRRRSLVALALVALGIVACVDIPANMKAQFAPAGPNDRTNYVPGRHGSAPPAAIEPMLPWDAGAPPVVDAAPPPAPDAADAGAV